mgnify:CR=1 FL=1
MCVLLFLVKQKTAYEIEYGLVGSEMCIRDRPGGVGELAGVLRRGYGGNGIDGRVLDTALRDSRSAWFCRESRQCTACKERLRSQVRCSRLPVAATVDELWLCLLYTSDAADERSSVDLGGRRIIKKKKKDSLWMLPIK